jgi:hypothetical protein
MIEAPALLLRGDVSMPTDLIALAERRRCALALKQNNEAIMLLSLIACEIILALLFAFPAFAEATALLGEY